MIRRILDRLTGREAASLRRQRDAHAEEAGRERQRRMDAEREWEDAVHTGLRLTLEAGADARKADARGITIWKFQNRLTRWQRRYYQMRAARDEALSQTAERSRQREQKASEHLWTLREMTDIAAQVKRELDAATALIERLTTARDEHALSEAATWLRARNFAALDADRKARGGAPVSAPVDLDVSDRDLWPDHRAELEGSRGGLAWMPGEASPDE